MNKQLIVRGKVQGVGFRYSAQQEAQKMGLTGWVKNKQDGSVELEVEGSDRKVDDFIQKLQDGLNRSIYVEDIMVHKETSQKGYEDFSIKR
ncbi:acylphosphatase [Virgibacillus xinjiangensis]|uniref:Acylphosphatase n=1 Tax=Virgibacillus xinjiangensis TaxID=393090 RepID=A0ABV7CRI5_9BACI